MAPALLVSILALSGCGPSKSATPSVSKEALSKEFQAASPEAKSVLVVVNSRSSVGKNVGAYYAAKRGIPRANYLLLDMPELEQISSAEYKTKIETPIRKAIAGSAGRIDYIVLTKGIPIRLDNGGGYSVDATLAACQLPQEPIREPKAEQIQRCLNPYYQSKEAFNSTKYKMWLVTRLDGYTEADCRKLVDQSIAAKAHKGPFLIDMAGNRTDGGYGDMQKLMIAASEILLSRNYKVTLDKEPAFMKSAEPLAGYVSWGSNDGQFNQDTYRSLRFLPGAVGETFVSTSGRTFNPTTGGQSLVADLIKGGITGIKGYVSEPYTFALAQPHILYDFYTRGYNLAESFYAASLVIKWKDVVIGDPLCRPYPKLDENGRPRTN